RVPPDRIVDEASVVLDLDSSPAERRVTAVEGDQVARVRGDPSDRVSVTEHHDTAQRVAERLRARDVGADDVALDLSPLGAGEEIHANTDIAGNEIAGTGAGHGREPSDEDPRRTIDVDAFVHVRDCDCTGDVRPDVVTLKHV